MSNPATFLNFAYGSNMLAARLRERVPSARAIGPAGLARYTLRWHKISKDGSGKCDVKPDAAPGACVWGVIYEIALAEKAALDQAEGLGNGYEECTVRVALPDDSVEVQLYYATKIDAYRVPYDWYKQLVVAGARANELPADYITTLEATPSKPDQDTARHRKNAILLARS